MDLKIDSWPAAVVIVSIVALAGVFVVTLGTHSPATLTTLGAALASLLVGQMRPALAAKGKDEEGGK